MRRPDHAAGRWPLAPAATAGALIFQLGHFAEHAAQMVMWLVHPQRAAWMSPVAHRLARELGRIPAPESAEMSSAMLRGMELLHLIGNSIFLLGAIGLLRLVQLRAGGRSAATAWARAGAAFQGLHTLEHVVLTTSVLMGGRAIGVSTWFGQLDGTQLTTQRVWWHGLVNLIATGLVAKAVWCARSELQPRLRFERTRASDSLVSAERWRVMLASVAVVLVVPTMLATLSGRSGAAADANRYDDTAFQSEAPGAGVTGTGELVDVATAVGLDVVHSAFRWDVTGDPVAMMGGGICWIDVDRDGWLDLFVTNTWSDGEWGLWNSGEGLPTTRVFRNNEGTFVDATERWNAGFEVRGIGCTVADVDEDGFPDLYVTTSRSNLLLMNDDGAGFVDVAELAGVELYGWQSGAAFGDLNSDGYLDLFVAGYADLNRPRTDSDSGFPNTVEARPDHVMFGTGVVEGVPRFGPNLAAELGIEPDGPEYGLDVVMFDVDGDGDLDVHVANDTQANRLYRNDIVSDGGFTDIAPDAGVADEGSGMGVAVGDVDADDVPDLAVTNLAGQGHRLFGSLNAEGGWTSHPGGLSELGLHQTGWGVAFADLDSDGVLDAVVASGDIPIVAETEPAPITVLRGTGPIDGEAAFALFVAWDDVGDLPARNGRGVAPADFDNDGDIDIAISGVGEPLVLLENRLPQEPSLIIDLGPLPAGSFVQFDLDDGRQLSWQATAGGGWLSAADHRIHLGLGSNEVAAIRVTVPGVEPRSIDVPALLD